MKLSFSVCLIIISLVAGVCPGEDEDRNEAVPSFKEAFTEALLTAKVSTQHGKYT